MPRRESCSSAYSELTLVDLADGTVRSSGRVTGSHIYTVTHNTKNFNPWDTLTPEEKVSELQALIRREIAAAIPKLMNIEPAPLH